MEIEVQGLDKALKLLEKFNKVILSDDLKIYLAKKSIEVINKIASERLDYNSNYIANNKFKLINNDILIYNDSKNSNGRNYSLIIEYGSGMYAELGHIGTTKTFENSGYVYWLVPVEDGSNLENYAFDVIDIKLEDGSVGSFYKVYGQEPKHIYTDAAKIIENNLSEWAKEFIDKEMKGL